MNGAKKEMEDFRKLNKKGKINIICHQAFNWNKSFYSAYDMVSTIENEFDRKSAQIRMVGYRMSVETSYAANPQLLHKFLQDTNKKFRKILPEKACTTTEQDSECSKMAESKWNNSKMWRNTFWITTNEIYSFSTVSLTWSRVTMSNLFQKMIIFSHDPFLKI